MTLMSIGGAVAATLLLFAGCGSDDDPAPAASAPGAVRVTETDFAIEPRDGRVDEPGTVRFAVANRGQAPHALAIETPDGVVQTDTLQAGRSGDLEAELEAGTYTWFCPVGDHRARGMEGKLTVGSGGGASSESSTPAGGSGY